MHGTCRNIFIYGNMRPGVGVALKTKLVVYNVTDSKKVDVIVNVDLPLQTFYCISIICIFYVDHGLTDIINLLLNMSETVMMCITVCVHTYGCAIILMS